MVDKKIENVHLQGKKKENLRKRDANWMVAKLSSIISDDSGKFRLRCRWDPSLTISSSIAALNRFILSLFNTTRLAQIFAKIFSYFKTAHK